MDDIGDEEDLFDQDFGDVPVNTFQQLEHDAITLSQRPPPTHNGWQQAEDHYPRNDDNGAGDADMELGADPPPPPSSDYGYDEEDVIDLNDPTFTFDRNAPPIVAFRTAPHIQRKSINHNVPELATTRVSDPADLERLQIRVAELENDRVRLNDALDSLRNESVTKDGAIANLRSRNQRSINDYESKIAALQKLHAEENSKLKAEIRVARNDQDNIKTSNRFLEHDLAQERERLKRLKAAAFSEPNNVANPQQRVATASTPKKAQAFSFRDGFDDHEIVAVSPTKIRTGTPKAGQKRKRNAVASPSIAPGHSPVPTPASIKPPPSEVDLEQELAIISKLSIRDKRFRVVQSVLSHRSTNDQRTIEGLSQYPLSGPDQATLASKMLEAISRIPPEDTMFTSVAIRKACLDLWEQCLVTKQFAPLPLVLGLFNSMLQMETNMQQVMLFERLLPLVAKTSVVVAEPRVIRAAQTSKETTNSVPLSSAPREEIDDYQVISLMHQVAISAALDPERASNFWRRAEFAFIMLMLNPAQPMPHLHLMLETVSSSTLEDSFGPRHGSMEVQVQQEADLLERLTSFLWESHADSGPRRMDSPEALLGLRLQILRTLRTISITEHGSRAMANNRTAIGRLTRFVCDQITLLYSTPPLSIPRIGPPTLGSSTIVKTPKKTSRHDTIVTTINLSIRIIHHLLQNHDIILDDKLSVIYSGKGKLIIALSRIAFSERSLLEAGLEDQVVDAANEILDLMLNPEEGEAIVQVMETPGGTHSGRLSLSAASGQDRV
ncbi:hypothetical protein K461DRAFT_277317 [Myriangium duriaei CBS 260.36]|uniref:DNA repair protein Rad26 n=1 Tax=Myriangium duriaei CBS 260.36 TaxID=1168546 RepID=A0A9P4MH05_9PEZI|nr:hypothetical protein K461DRAFT_277317 [Myriangium duriaei CBS 260.36]